MFGSSGERLGLSQKVQEEVFQGAMECCVDPPRARKVTGTATFGAQATLRWGGFLQELSPQEGSCFPLSTGWGGRTQRGTSEAAWEHPTKYGADFRLS